MKDKNLRNIFLISFIVLFTIALITNTAFADTIGAGNNKQQIKEIETKNDYVIPLFLLGPILASLLTLFVKQIQRLHVKHYSTVYNDLLALNEKYSFFEDIPASYSLTHMMKSKQALERANANEIFLYEMYNDSTLEAAFEKISSNISMFEKYMEEYKNMKEKGMVDGKRKFNQDVEQKMCEKIIKNPVQDIKVDLKLEYISAKGKKHYWKSFSASYKNLLYVYKEVPYRQIMKYQAQVERSKMSDALRYKVLTRDGHRCVICGATAQDGVKLHVDHIIPVSKGGKTELNNLRTLCERCNLGKSNRYNINGIN